jgi:low affinity Fe/Cu permease
MSEVYINPLGAELENSVFYLQNAVKKLKQVDSSAATTEIASLKEKLNYILQEVLGLEHTLDGITNYDTSSIKTQIDTVIVDIDELKKNTRGIEIHERTADPNDDYANDELVINNYRRTLIGTLDDWKFKNTGTCIDFTRDGMLLSSIIGLNEGRMDLANSGISIESTAHVRINAPEVEIRGLKIEKDNSHIKFTDTTNPDRHVTIPWE